MARRIPSCLTADEAVERLRTLKMNPGKLTDLNLVEAHHIEAEEIVLAALRGAGLVEVVKEFQAAKKRHRGFWYS